jgi:hypothetical protein
MDVVRNRMRGEHGRPSETSTMQNVQCAAEHLIDQQPAFVALAAFGIGLGLGVGLGALIANWASESVDNRTEFEKMTENVMQRVSAMVPEAVARYFRS